MTVQELQTLSDWAASSIRTLGMLRDKTKDQAEREKISDQIKQWTARQEMIAGMMNEVFASLETPADVVIIPVEAVVEEAVSE
jgi:hypothetical protein